MRNTADSTIDLCVCLFAKQHRQISPSKCAPFAHCSHLWPSASPVISMVRLLMRTYLLTYIFCNSSRNHQQHDVMCTRLESKTLRSAVTSAQTSWVARQPSGQRAGLRRSRAWVEIAVAMLSGNSLRQTVRTHRASVHQAAKLVAALLSVAVVTAGLAESNSSLPPGF